MQQLGLEYQFQLWDSFDGVLPVEGKVGHQEFRQKGKILRVPLELAGVEMWPLVWHKGEQEAKTIVSAAHKH